MERTASRVRRGLRTVMVGVAAGSCFIAAGGFASAASASAPPASVTVARYGAGWLARQIIANGGSLDQVPGTPDPTDTAYAVLGLHAAGVGRTAASKAMGFLETDLGAISAGGSDDPGVLAEFIVAAHTSGVDPYHFGGNGVANNLVARLVATSRSSGPDAGLFGSQDPSFDGAFRQGLALAALKAAGVPKSRLVVARGIGWLARQQCANGLWESYRSDTATACLPADPSTFTGPDTNSTSLAVQGLAVYGDHPREAGALFQLHSIQSSDGGYPFVAAGGQSSDPDSTALVIQALIAEGQNPASATWATSGSTPFMALASYQRGCTAAASDRGAFFFPGSSTPNIIATVQAVPAAAGKAIPVAPTTLSTAQPTMTC